MNDHDRGVPVLIGDRSTSLRWDDVEHFGGVVPDQPRIIVDERLASSVQEMPEQWLRSRVRGWMELTESPDLDFWIGTYAGRQWIWCSSRGDSYAPLQHRIDYARGVCKHLNRACAHGGAWLTGWIRGGHEFYALWKDPDGDISIPLECDVPFTQLIGWSNYNWEQHANGAIEVWRRFQEAIDASPDQKKSLAQGQRVSATHLKEAPPVGLP